MVNLFIQVLNKTISDYLLAVICIIPIYYYMGGHPPAIPLLVISIISAVIYTYFIYRPTLKKQIFIISNISMVVCIGVVFTFNIYLIIGCMLYALYMGFFYFKHGIDSNRGVKALVFGCIALFYYVLSLVYNYPHNDWIIGLYLCFLFLYLAARLHKGWLQSRLGLRQRSIFIMFIPFIFLFAWVGAMTLPIFAPIVKNIFMYLIAVPLGLLAWVFSPILNWIMGFDLSEEIYNDNKSEFFEIMFTTNKTAAETITLSNGLFIGLPFLVAILVFVLIIRKGRMKKRQAVRSYGSIYNGNIVKKNTVKGWVFKQEPVQVVRRQVWKLEKFAVKMKAEREWGETIEEWLDRIEVNIEERGNFTHIYNACRYGEKNISDSDTKWFKERTKLIRQSIKENKKKYKEKSEKEIKQVDQGTKREKSIMDSTTEMNLKRKTGG